MADLHCGDVFWIHPHQTAAGVAVEHPGAAAAGALHPASYLSALQRRVRSQSETLQWWLGRSGVRRPPILL